MVTDLGPYFAGFPSRLRIETSADGVQWDTVWTGSTAVPTYYAGVRHPKEVPVVFPIGREGVRFVRLTQIGSRKDEWIVAEVRVLK